MSSLSRALHGDKAFYLSQVMERGYPIVPGFVVPASVGQQFLERVNWSDPLLADFPASSLHLDVHNSQQLQRVARQIRRELLATDLGAEIRSHLVQACQQVATPDTNSVNFWIFRPSLAILGEWTTLDFPVSGLLTSQICSWDMAHLELALKQVWAELYRARSLFYWQSLGISLEQLQLAVLVQPMQDAVVSGFSQTLTTHQWEVQATWGLGTAYVSGALVPDSFWLNAVTGNCENQVLGRKTLVHRLAKAREMTPIQEEILALEQQQQSSLTESQLQQLFTTMQGIQRDFATPFTLEWIWVQQSTAHPHLYITQLIPQVTAPATGTGASKKAVREPLNLPSSALMADVDVSSWAESVALSGVGVSPGMAIAPAQVIVGQTRNLEISPHQKILVAKAIAPDWVPLLKQAAGIVTETGGMTSHGAIIAREFGIPAVVGVPHATELIANGASLLVDGDKGEVLIVSPELAPRLENTPIFKSVRPRQNLMTGTRLMVNLCQPESLARLKDLPVDGVGLLRSELMLLEGLAGESPQTWVNQGRGEALQAQIVERVSQFTTALNPRPVFYRSLDWRQHEFSSFHDASIETNPVIGMRGTFSYLQNPAVFDVELAALAQLRRQNHRNLHLILPFVRTVEEFIFCRQRVEQAGLNGGGDFQLWIMAEVPSVLFLLEAYVKAGCQGISIGTNDLTQLLLGVDRDRAEMASLFDERHPAITQAIVQLMTQSRQLGIPCSICGQAPALYPELIEQWVNLGIHSISVELEALERTHQAIVRAEQRMLLEAARRGTGAGISE